MKQEVAEVGVLVGRYQVDELHEGQIAVIESVVSKHRKILLFLGLSPARVTRNNPLDFEARKQMILARYPNINILYIKDVPSDEVWSHNLDEQIADLVGPTATVLLYGGRESFIDHYTGKYPTTEVEEVEFRSGTAVRKQLGAHVKADPAFRAGVIWAAYNRFPTTFPTVDVAIWNAEKTKLLMAQKPHETKFRFIGGFVGPRETLEAAARREADEETHVAITDPVYVGSCPIDDWRYRRELDGIVTVLFESQVLHGRPTPDDDISKLAWISVENFQEVVTVYRTVIVHEHKPLFEMLMKKNRDVDVSRH